MPMSPRLLRPIAGRAAAKPSALPVTSGLALWLDANDPSTFTMNGSGVAEWRDKSGNGRHFAQSTALRQPALSVGVKNGRSAVAFTNDWLSGTYTYPIGSLFIVWEHPTTVAGDSQPAIIGSRTNSSNKVANSTLDYVLTLPSASNVAVDPLPASPTFRLNGIAVSGSFQTYFLGVAVRTSPDRWQYHSATFSVSNGSKAIVLGADAFSTTGRLMQNGHIGEVIAYSTTLISADVLLIENYLIQKWGLQ